MKQETKKLMELMEKDGIDALIIPSSDFHNSEYICDYFKSREFLSEFTGSAGTLVLTRDKAYLWTDGRYFIQAKNELPNDIQLMPIGEENIPSIDEFLLFYHHIGFDGRLISMRSGVFYEKNHTIIYDKDYVDCVWTERPPLVFSKAFVHNKTRFSSAEKIEMVRKSMAENSASVFILSALDDIAWLTNLRGFDIECNPVNLCYLVLTMDNVFLFIDNNKIKGIDIAFSILPYNDIYNFVSKYENENIMLDSSKTNYLLYKCVEKNNIIDLENPTTRMKAIKNDIEIMNIENAHLKDGIATTKFMYWLKNNVGKMKITELMISDKLLELRKEQPDFLEPSFDTIAGYNEHGAIIHYSATEKTNASITANGLVLIDSGGQYLDGTTDITRTYVLGDISDDIKKHYTLVLKGLIDLSKSKFLYGCRGINLDILARQHLWQINLDYKCGSGHGVGYLLNVHEGPNGFRWRASRHNDNGILEAGMITTIEPGVYIEGQYGIRLENEILCVNDEKNEYGNFLSFKTITLSPFDTDGVDFSLLDKSELDFLINYQNTVYEKINTYLTQDEKEWLKEYIKIKVR